MRHRSRITEDEAMERARERHSEQSVADLELTICRQAMRIQQLERQVAELSESAANRKLAQVINLLGLRYAHSPNYIHSAFTDSDRRELAGLLCVEAYSNVQEGK